MTIPASPKPIIPLLPYQRADVESTARFQWNCWARQTGKSFTKSLRRILRGIFRRKNQIFLSAGERQSRELMQKARAHCQALNIATDLFQSGDLHIRDLEIALPGGVRIIALPANPHTIRGFTGDVLLDEFAMHQDDREIWAAIFPTLLRGNGELDIASTPHGKNNMFYHLRDNPMFHAHTLTLYEAIAQGLDVSADQIRQAMGDDQLFRQEFLCEFIDEATAFLTYDQIAACCNPALPVARSIESIPPDCGELFAGVDIGRHRDLTVLWIVAISDPKSAPCDHPLLSPAELAAEGFNSSPMPMPRPCPSTLLSTVAVIELAAATFTRQFDVLCRMMALHGLCRCCIDAGGLGMQLAEQLSERFGRHRVEPIVFTPALKSQLAGALRIAVEQRRFQIPDDERIRRDWHSVERTMTDAGHFRLEASRAEGSHADRFWAAALALHAVHQPCCKPEAILVHPLRFACTGTW